MLQHVVLHNYMHYHWWLGLLNPKLFFCRYARMMSEGHKMDIVYFDPYPNKFLEEYIRDYGKLLEAKGERPVSIRKLETVEEVLKEADVRPDLYSHHQDNVLDLLYVIVL